jgi:phage FluMu gp28-like protein
MPELPPWWTPPPLAGYQMAFMASGARYTIIEAATKTGKTAACLVWLLREALAGRRGQNFWWVAPVKRQALIAQRRMARTFYECRKDGYEVVVQQSEGRLTLPGGQVISFLSGFQTDNLYGEDVCAVVIDEATRCKEGTWHAVRSTLTATGGPAMIIGNVKGRQNWVRSLIHRAHSEGRNSDYAVYRITAYDAAEAGIVTLAEIEDAKASLPEAMFRELYLAEPAEDGANPFGLESIRNCLVTKMSSRPARFFGVDLARHHDWTVIIGLDDRGVVASFERLKAPWATITERIRAMVGRQAAFIDSTGVGDPIAEELERSTSRIQRFQFNARSKQHLMEELAMAIQAGEVHFPDGIIAEELRQMQRMAERAAIRYEAAAGQHDDCVCALALAWHCKRNAQPAGAFDFSLS